MTIKEARETLFEFICGLLVPAGFDKQENGELAIEHHVREQDQLVIINGRRQRVPGREFVVKMTCHCDGPNSVETVDKPGTRRHFELVYTRVEANGETMLNMGHSIYYKDDYESELKTLFNQAFGMKL